MVAVQVIGNDAAIAIAGSQGNFELNVYKPLMIHNLIQSIHLLADGVNAFCDKCLIGIQPNRKRLAEYVEKSLMLATALNESIGYDQAAKIVHKAYQEDISLKSAAIKLGILSPEKFDALVDLKKMVHPDQQ